MAQRICQILVAYMLIFLEGVSGQEKKSPIEVNSPIYEDVMTEVKNSNPISELSMLKNFYFFKNFSFVDKKSFRIPGFIQKSYPLSEGIHVYNYNNPEGFFCRKETELEKLTGIPLRFRLGSLAYVNGLERK